ncbi:MAG: hypothetical protein EOO38_29805, partial [Cytophagaceae bacterium]
MWIADTFNNRVRFVSEEGNIETIAGTGDTNVGNSFGPAKNVSLASPRGLSVLGNENETSTVGRLWIADSGHCRILFLNSDGNISIVAGTGVDGYSGDEGLAVNAMLSSPHGVTAFSSDNCSNNVQLFICDTVNSRVRLVNKHGIITTIAGTGGFGSLGDNGPAVNATLNLPHSVAVLPGLSDNGGSVRAWISTFGDHRIRYINEQGIISTFAGTGARGYEGDGGLAINAHIGFPTGIAVLPVAGDGPGVRVWVSCSDLGRIFQIDEDGIISTFAGTDKFGF